MSKDIKKTPVVQGTIGVTPEISESAVSTTNVDENVATVNTVTLSETNANETEVSTVAVSTAVLGETNTNEDTVSTDLFVSSNGDEFYFTVDTFAFKGERYTKEKAIAEHSDVLEHLVSINSFILKKV